MSPNETLVDKPYQRWADRQSFKEVKALYKAALKRREEGELEIAWDRLARALNEYVWLFYAETTGKVRSQVRDPGELLTRLHSGKHVDGWARHALPAVLFKPDMVKEYQLDILQAVVEAVCFPEKKANA